MRQGRPQRICCVRAFRARFLRRAVERPEGTVPLWAVGRTAERQRAEPRRRFGATYDQAGPAWWRRNRSAGGGCGEGNRSDQHHAGEGGGGGLELSTFSTFDTMASKIRGEVNIPICTSIHDRMSTGVAGGAAATGRSVESVNL